MVFMGKKQNSELNAKKYRISFNKIQIDELIMKIVLYISFKLTKFYYCKQLHDLYYYE